LFEIVTIFFVNFIFSNEMIAGSVLKKLWTSDILFGTATVNSWNLTAGLCQVLITVSVCSLAKPFWLNWWLLCDAIRVFISGCLRMDYLLREQLQGQEVYLARLRRALAVLNMLGMLFGVCVLVYKPLQVGKPLDLFVLTIIVLCLHLVTSLPAVGYLIQGRDIIRNLIHELEGEEEDQSRAPLLGRGERDESKENVISIEEVVTSDYVNPFPQNLPRQLSGDPSQCIPLPQHDATCPLSGILPVTHIPIESRIHKENPITSARDAIRQQQDLEYDIMITEHRNNNEEKKHECTNESEKVLEPVELKRCVVPEEPSQNDEYAVEMRFLAPNGTQVARRFSRNSTLNIVISWVRRTLRELSITYEEGFRICERYPRKVYDQSQYHLTLEALKFWSSARPTPQRSSVLILELL
jgi:hypothetical protein